MKVLVVAVGRVRGDLASAVGEYETRAARYWKLDVVEVEAGTKGRNPDPDRVKDTEAERILSKIPPGMDVIALTRAGRSLDSRALARALETRAVNASPGVAFVLGGAFGLGETVLRRSETHLALSAMTLPHEMARLVLAEQLYRAGTILRGEPYHKGA